jgi:hypothetical protein
MMMPISGAGEDFTDIGNASFPVRRVPPEQESEAADYREPQAGGKRFRNRAVPVLSVRPI